MSMRGMMTAAVWSVCTLVSTGSVGAAGPKIVHPFDWVNLGIDAQYGALMKWNGESWVDSAQLTVISDGGMLTGIVAKNGNEEELWKHSYEYDSDGLVAKEVVEEYKDGAWSAVNTITLTNTVSSGKISMSEGSFVTADRPLFRKKKFTYDGEEVANDSIWLKRGADASFELVGRNSYRTLTSGGMTRVDISLQVPPPPGAPNVWRMTSKVTLLYNADGNLLSVAHKTFSAGRFLKESLDSMVYENGAVTERILYEGVDDQWVKVSRYVFSDTPVGLVPKACERRLEGFDMRCFGRSSRSLAVVFSLPRPASVTLQIFDPRGNLLAAPLKQTYLSEGTHHTVWSGRSDLPAGHYAVRMAAGRVTVTRPMVLTR